MINDDSGVAYLRKCFQPRQWFMHEGEPYPFTLSDEDTFMWVYQAMTDGTGRFQVGYFFPDGQWCPDGDYPDRGAAAARVNYLNGGGRK